MRHRLAHRKLNRNPSQRKALLRGLATQLLEHGRIVTTLERAKELRGVVEPLVAKAREDSVSNRRYVAARVYGETALKRLFSEIAPANAQRPGGYTRILKLGFRPGDHARRAVIEFVEANLVKDNSAAATTA
ncbi:MAG: 50S ribosomal protein L17 [Silvanigrellales bacterium]|jgi:large subunit ribosomal protein L17|nr:50S ribosomal protein L17 [Silvanigrellales bacterium]